MRNGSGGGLGLLQDTQLIETLAHFSRERIPERYVLRPLPDFYRLTLAAVSVVHAKAAG